jgi:hypothetical protein
MTLYFISASYRNEEISMRKKLSYFTAALFLFLCALFFGSWWDKGSQFFNEEYGINPVLLTAIMIITEIFFNIGIVMMLVGSGVHKLRWKDVWVFDFDCIHFSGRMVYWGFWVNRIASAIPSSYVLWAGFSKLPGWVNGLVILELSAVVLVGFLIQAYIIEKKTL